MPNTSVVVRAAAEGMPEINRRRLLLGLAAASTAAAAITVAPAAHSAASAENPELIRLGDMLAEVEGGYVAANKKQKSIEKEWGGQWPLAPDEITEPGKEKAWSGFERRFNGGGLWRKGEEHPRTVIPAWSFAARASRARRILKGSTIDKRNIEGMGRLEWEAELTEAQRNKPIALRYEAECKRIQEAAGALYKAAWQDTAAKAEALEAHVAAIMDQPDLTMNGLLIKAQALAAWGKVEGIYSIPFRHGIAWPRQIAASIMRHANSGETS